MHMTKKILIAALFIFILATSIAAVLAAPKETTTEGSLSVANTTTTDTGVKAEKVAAKEATNQTFSACMQDAVTAKQTSYNAHKTARKTCLDATATTNTTDVKKSASKMCEDDYKKAMKNTKEVFTAARNECRQIKHTMWEGFKAYFQ